MKEVRYIMKAKRRSGIALILFGVLLCLTGCGIQPSADGSVKAEDGRSYGGLTESGLGQTVHTVFFDLTVNSAEKYSTYQFQDGLYIADEDMAYLVVEVTITNTYDKDLPMSITDFTLDYSGNDNEQAVVGFGEIELSDDTFMDSLYTLKRGDSVTKSILYTVPDRAEYLLCYKEYYEDKFEGDSYEITMVPEVIEPAVSRQELESSVSSGTEETEAFQGENAGEQEAQAGEAAIESSGASTDETDTSTAPAEGETGENDESGAADTGIIEE